MYAVTEYKPHKKMSFAYLITFHQPTKGGLYGKRAKAGYRRL